jgi:hypothetical protein
MKPFPKWLLLVSSMLTALTGVAYFWMKRFLVSDDPFAVVGHPLEPWALKAHILCAPVLVFAIGLVTTDHIWRNWRCLIPAGRRTGLTSMAAIVPMIASGYLIQAVTSIGWLEALAWLHLGAGLVYVVGLLAHQQIFRRWAKVAVSRARPGRAPSRGKRLPTSTRRPAA